VEQIKALGGKVERTSRPLQNCLSDNIGAASENSANNIIQYGATT